MYLTKKDIMAIKIAFAIDNYYYDKDTNAYFAMLIVYHCFNYTDFSEERRVVLNYSSFRRKIPVKSRVSIRSNMHALKNIDK